MNDAITAERLRLRRQTLAGSIVQENAQADIKEREAERHRSNAADFAIRLDEIDGLLKEINGRHDSQNVIPMRPAAGDAIPTKPSLRYRNPGATSDIVALAYDTPGISIDSAITTVYEKYRHEGTTSETISKMVRRMIREGYAYREGSKLFLTDLCKNAWESSPLYRAS